MPRRRWTPGAILRIPVGDQFSYARQLAKSPYVAYYEGRDDGCTSTEEIVQRRVIFVLATSLPSLADERWGYLGVVSLREESAIPIPLMFMQDIGDPARFRVIDEDGRIREATREQCLHLERAAVWEPHHVEERLRDHYAGRPNPTTGHLRPT